MRKQEEQYRAMVQCPWDGTLFGKRESDEREVKLGTEAPRQYGVSRVFEMRNPGNELYTVLRILKYFRQEAEVVPPTTVQAL